MKLYVWVAVVAPVSVMVTVPVAFPVSLRPEVKGVYCTAIVQLLPGLITEVGVQLPPRVIAKVPVPLPPVFAIVGAAVNVRGPAVAPVAELVTVMVPAFCFVLVGTEVNAGTGPVITTVAPVTVNVAAPLPPGIETVLAVLPAVAAIVNVAVAEVAEATV
jgi:hypothetical protein